MVETTCNLAPVTSLALLSADAAELLYLLVAVLFIFGLKLMANVRTAARGNMLSAVGMLVAAAVTLMLVTPDRLAGVIWVLAAMAIGGAIGLVLALRVPMTGMPQMVGLLNGFGGVASLLVASADYLLSLGQASHRVDALLATALAMLIGGVTFTGSLVAFAKLQELKLVPSRPVRFAGQKVLIAALLVGAVVMAGLLTLQPDNVWLVVAIGAFALVLGVLLVIGIGGADMPVVVALLNSYSGLAAAMVGFVLNSHVLIITGSLVGASGLILTQIMCKAMNRSLANVLFGGVGGAVAAGPGNQGGQVHTFTPEDAAMVMEAAQQVIIVPGYGMAVAQAQHAVKSLAAELARRGVTVRYAIHPVAGRMPGHMNVLLAEAGIPYEQLLDLDQGNPEFERTDVALVIGANDVTNPAARHLESSPIYGMPILDVDKARTVFVIKRSLGAGFAGVENELYFYDNCGMILGDARAVVTDLTAELENI